MRHLLLAVNVTIGLFGIIKLYRIVSLLVESKGFSIAPPCENILPPNPCEFFETLDFPMDVFSPPQKREFHAGISENIPTHVLGGIVEMAEMAEMANMIG